VIYGAFFRHVVFLDDVAARLAAMGNSGNYPRSEIQQRARLTDMETAALKSVAADCEAKLAAMRNAVQTLVRDARSQTPRQDPLPAWLTQQAQDLYSQREPLIAEHIQQLKNLFGSARFQHLDGYVHATSTVRVGSGTPAPPPTRPAP
jgi:hypothetical protein